MRNIKILLAGGMVLMIAAAAFASNGNPRLLSSTAGAGTAKVFCGAKPYQDDNATSGSLYLLAVTTNYFIDTAAYPNYTKYGVTSTPITTTVGYLLLSDTSSNKYATPSFTLGSPVGPADQVISSITWYNRGKPDAPSSLTAEAGFETAKLTWELNPNPTSKNYDYSSIEITIKKNSDGSVLYENGTISPTVLGGTAKSYTLGELIDGRKLEPGTKYDVSIVGKVLGKADKSVVYTSDPATVSFTTAGAGPQTFILTLESQTQSTPAGPGINNFAMPFAAPWYAYDKSSGSPINVGYNNTNELKTAYHLVRAINYVAGSNVISTFGRWDKTNQVVSGVTMSSPYTPVESQLNIPLLQGEGYQVYMYYSKAELVIKNTSQ